MKFKNILILVGGSSTRFWPLSHKMTIPFLGKKLIEHQLELYVQFAESLIVITNQDTYDETQKIAEKYNAKVFIQNGDGQSSAILSAQDSLKGETLVVNGNDVFKRSLINQIIDRKNLDDIDGLLVAKKVNSYFPGGYLEFKNDKLSGIVEKPPPDGMPSPYWRFVIDYIEDIHSFLTVLSQSFSEKDEV